MIRRRKRGESEREKERWKEKEERRTLGEGILELALIIFHSPSTSNLSPMAITYLNESINSSLLILI